MDPEQLWLTALRTLAVYACVLVILRLLGKREIGNFSPFDLLVALMLGEVVDEAIYGDVPFLQFLVAAVIMGLCQYVTGWMTCASRAADRVLEGTPTVLIRDGEMQSDAMRKERVAESELMALLREQAIDDLREVRLGTLEVAGKLSVLKQDWAQPLQKGDLLGPESLEQQEDTHGREEPPADRQTYSPRALGREAA